MSHETNPEEWEYPIDKSCFEYSNVTVDVLEPKPVVYDMLMDEDEDVTRTIVAGSRTIYDEEVVRKGLEVAPDQWFDPIAEIIHGDAHGVDTTAAEVIREDLLADVIVAAGYKGKYGTRGPLLRNGDMASYADNLIAIWDGVSTGTEDMFNKALNKGLNVHVHQI